MSATLSELAARALRAQASQPALKGRRFLLAGLFGLAPQAVFEVLAQDLEVGVGVDPGNGGGGTEVEVQALRAGDNLLIPYLVDEGHPTSNSGSAGFAATLRTQFAGDGDAEPRVLLICAKDAVETVSSATEHASDLRALSFGSLTVDALEAVAAAKGLQPTALERQLVGLFGGSASASVASFEDLLGWLEEDLGRSPEILGRDLWRLGFLSDPGVAQDPDDRLKRARKLRRQLDEAYASAGKSFAAEVRKLLVPGGAPSGAADKVLGAATAFGLDYTQFTYDDIKDRAQRPRALGTDPVEPVRGSRGARRSADSIVVWMPAGACAATVVLTRPALSGETLRLRWADGGEANLTRTDGCPEAALQLPAAPERTWQFGMLEIGLENAEGLTEELHVAIHRSDSGWFCLEQDVDVDAGQAAFLAERVPVAVLMREGGEVVGRSEQPDAGRDGERTVAEVGYHGETCPLPVISLGEDVDGDPPEGDPDDPDDPDPDPVPRDPFAEPFPSVPHALLAAGRAEWPSSAKLAGAGDGDGPQVVSFQVGARHLAVERQAPAGLDGAAVELAILEHPEWTSYVWSPETGKISRGAGPSLADSGFDASLVAGFMEAREALFAAARDRGSVYAVDPAGAEVSAYADAYLALIEGAQEGGAHDTGWDASLLCDAVEVGGRAGELLFAPTSPVAVAFHAGLLETFGSWTRAADVPAGGYRATLGLRHAVPLLHAGEDWYEAVRCEGLLWRQYSLLARQLPNAADRNARFIAQRLRFFLKVHPTYADPRQVLSVTFAQPGGGGAVFQALANFYARERGNDEGYELPRMEVTLVGADPSFRRDFDQNLAAIGRDDLVRLVQSRVTITTASRPPAFSHVAFLFRTPGVRGARLMDMAGGRRTAFLGGLAAAPARAVTERGRVFAWGTWAPPTAGAGRYEQLLTRSLELVGGQPAGRLEPGWTNMISTTFDRDRLRAEYGQTAIWVVHLDRLLGIEAFGEGDPEIIEYEDRADPDEPGYDGITTTRFIDPYRDAIARALRRVDQPAGSLGSPTDGGLRQLLQRLNAVSGRWAIEILQRPDPDILATVGVVAAIAAVEQLEGCIGSSEQGTGMLIALDDLIPDIGRAGIPRVRLHEPTPEGKLCDDLLLLWIPRSGSSEALRLRGAVIEVKYQGRGTADVDEARGEIARTREWLSRVFNSPGSSRPFRARDLAELVAGAAARAQTFGLGAPLDHGHLHESLDRIAAGHYELDLRHWRGGSEKAGIAIAVESQSTVAAAQGDLPAPGDAVDHLRLGKPLLANLIAEAALDPGRRWTQLSFEEPGGGPAGDARGGGAEPPAAGPPGVPGGGPGEGAPERPLEDAAADPAVMSDDVLAEVVAVAAELDAAMARYKLAAEPFLPEHAQVGPNVIRLRTKPLGTVGVADVHRRAADLGREVGAPHPVYVSQEPYYICIDVPRRDRQPVLYAALAGEAPQDPTLGALDFIVGVAPSGEVRMADLARLPHLLVAGATGSGKSVFLRSLLCHLVRTRGPERLRLLIIDPKQLDFRGFRSLPHLEGGKIVTEPLEAIAALKATIEREREPRLDILEAAGVASATEFYEAGGDPRSLPQMVVLVDEFADLVGALPRNERDEFLAVVQRYVQITRAMGIYMVLATQRPSVDVITGSIKANLPARVALSLPSNRDSQTIIDQAGAEDLLGGGDLLYYLGGRIERLQAPLAGVPDVGLAVERWSGVANPRPERYWERT